jgi:hypothetical protein
MDLPYSEDFDDHDLGVVKSCDVDFWLFENGGPVVRV